MGRRRLPWFKVQHRLTSHTKFRNLSSHLQASLIKLWCCAAEYERDGLLPDIKRIAYHMGNTYMVNPSRVQERVLNPLIRAGWIVERNGYMYCNDWAYWQRSDSGGYQPADQPADQPAVGTADSSGADSIALTGQLTPYRDIEVQINSASHCKHSSRDRDNASGICSDGKVDICSVAHGGGDIPDALTVLKYHVCQEWEGLRGMSAATIRQKDWVQVVKMWKAMGESIGLEALRVSFTRFAGSADKWDRKQSVGYWASNLHRYLVQNSRSGGGGKYATYDSNWVAQDADLEWWKGKG